MIQQGEGQTGKRCVLPVTEGGSAYFSILIAFIKQWGEQIPGREKRESHELPMEQNYMEKYNLTIYQRTQMKTRSFAYRRKITSEFRCME